MPYNLVVDRWYLNVWGEWTYFSFVVAHRRDEESILNVYYFIRYPAVHPGPSRESPPDRRRLRVLQEERVQRQGVLVLQEQQDAGEVPGGLLDDEREHRQVAVHAHASGHTGRVQSGRGHRSAHWKFAGGALADLAQLRGLRSSPVHTY